MKYPILLLSLSLGACGFRDNAQDNAQGEADPICYHTVALIADDAQSAASNAARAALSDGFLTNGEYKRVIAISDDEFQEQYRRDKAAAIAKWAIGTKGDANGGKATQ